MMENRDYDDPHSIGESLYVMLKALKNGRLTAYTVSGMPLPASYWKDKTVASLSSGDYRFEPEECMRVFPPPAPR